MEAFAMHKFMCTHTLPAGSLTYDQLCQIADATQHDLDVRGYRSFVNLTDGKICCVLESEDRDKIVSWFKKMDIPYDDIFQVEWEGERGVFEDVREPAFAGVL
jgi:hypothetical protein